MVFDDSALSMNGMVAWQETEVDTKLPLKNVSLTLIYNPNKILKTSCKAEGYQNVLLRK